MRIWVGARNTGVPNTVCKNTSDETFSWHFNEVTGGFSIEPGEELLVPAWIQSYFRPPPGTSYQDKIRYESRFLNLEGLTFLEFRHFSPEENITPKAKKAKAAAKEPVTTEKEFAGLDKDK